MEIRSFFASHLYEHYKKIIILCTATATIYMIKKYMDKRKNKSNSKKEKKKIKEFPTVEEIQKFIEDLPFDEVATGKAVTLKDLLGELSEFSEDEDWKELIASVHTLYQEKPGNIENIEETESVNSIYEDSNIITFQEMSPRDQEQISVEIVESKGNGDVVIETSRSKTEKKKINENLELGEGDQSQSIEF